MITPDQEMHPPLALAELDLVDEYDFVVHRSVAGHGPTLFFGVSRPVDLKLKSRVEFGSGAVALRYEPVRSDASQYPSSQP